MKKIVLLSVSLLSCAAAFAGDGDKFTTVSGGWQHRRTMNAVVGLEFEGMHHNAWELYIDLSNAWATAPDGKIYSNTLWDYRTFGIGAAYKPVLTKGKNTVLRWRFGADVGANRRGFQASLDVGLEFSYSFRNRMQLFVLQKNDVVFWSRDHFRNGVLIGVKIPITR